MRNKKTLIFILLLTLFCHPSFLPADQEKTAVMCAEAETTVEMLACLSQRLAVVEALMAERLNRLMGCLNSTQQEKLQQGQNIWLRFRVLNAELEASAEVGGSLYAVERLTTLVDMTRQRGDELDRLYMKFSAGNAE